VADEPLVSVVTPTWQRHRILLERCIPSVQSQDYPNVQHVIVSDGPDPELASRLLTWQDRHPVVYGFAYSQMAWHSASGEAGAVGWDVPAYCAISTQMIMHRRELLEISDWGPWSPEEDWELVSRWLNAGVAHVHVPLVTVDVWPSSIFGGNLPPKSPVP